MNVEIRKKKVLLLVVWNSTDEKSFELLKYEKTQKQHLTMFEHYIFFIVLFIIYYVFI